jgi:hypothetical protein
LWIPAQISKDATHNSHLSALLLHCINNSPLDGPRKLIFVRGKRCSRWALDHDIHKLRVVEGGCESVSVKYNRATAVKSYAKDLFGECSW